MYIDKNGIKFTGAGILIVEDYHKKDGTFEPCILLVRSRRTEMFMDFGGTYESKHRNLKITAYQEMIEESVNLLDIHSKFYNTYVDVPGKEHFYRAYIIKVNGVNRKYYHINKNLIDERAYLFKKGTYKEKIPWCWRETDDIRHIPIKNIDFNKLNTSDRIMVKDIDNKETILHDRTRAILYQAQAEIFNAIKCEPIVDKKSMIKTKSDTFTDGTFTFKAL